MKIQEKLDKDLEALKNTPKAKTEDELAIEATRKEMAFKVNTILKEKNESLARTTCAQA